MPIGAFSVRTTSSLLVAVARRSIFFATRIISRFFGTLLFSEIFLGAGHLDLCLLPFHYFAASFAHEHFSHSEHEPCNVHDRHSLPLSSTLSDEFDAAAPSRERSF